MTIDGFWEIVDRVHAKSKGEMDQKCVLLEKELRKLSVPEIASFDQHFDEANGRAYTWPLWAAAYILNGGCSDDSFMDLRATLISMGRKTFEAAVKDPDSLADMDLEDGKEMVYEGYQYVPMQLLEELAPGQEFPGKPHPKTPTGKRWDEDKAGEVCPRLEEKYG